MSERACPKCGVTRDWGEEFEECEDCDPDGASDGRSHEPSEDALAASQAKVRRLEGERDAYRKSGESIAAEHVKVCAGYNDERVAHLAARATIRVHEYTIRSVSGQRDRAAEAARAAEGERDGLRELLAAVPAAASRPSMN